MASISNLTSPNTQFTSLKSSPLLSFASPSYHHQPKRTSNGSSSRRTLTISCNGGSMDRRDLLIGLGGLYGATSGGLAIPGPAFGAPIAPPDLSKCQPASVTDSTGKVVILPDSCCPPFSPDAVDYIPTTPTRIRVRPAVQNATKEQLDKYKEATRLMKLLDKDDPRSFMQQAMVHCAYCNNAYNQVGILPSQPIQVHSSWLFFPFHRWYLYFYEKILGKLIGDKDFVMPFWNYDDPAGMMIPEVFDDPNSSLYDPIRNQTHRRPKVIDLDFGTDASLTDQQLIENNLKVMYRQMVTNSKKPQQFFGAKYVAGGTPSPGSGTVESVPHSPVHVWVGSAPSTATPFRENMGNFYSAGRDPIFYCHHMNVDRLWNVWKELSPKNRDPRLPEFVDASFLFYDENAQLVRVKVKDCLNSSLLGYRYDSVPLAWLEKQPKSTVPRTPPKKRKIIKNPKFPLTLQTAVSTTVKRSRKSRSKKEKDDEEEVVVIEGIDLNRGEFVKFDVFVNSPDNAVTPGSSEFAGSFVNVPHRGAGKGVKTKLTLGLTDLLDDIKADDDDDIIVTIVPRKGTVEIGGVSIEFLGDDI